MNATRSGAPPAPPPPAPGPSDPNGPPPGLLADLRAALSSDEVALKVLVASAVVLAVGWLGVKEAVGGVIASQVLSEAIKNWVQRRQPSHRRMWLVTLLLLLLEFAQRALAAVRRAFRVQPDDGRSVITTGWRAGAVTSVLAGFLTVMLFTAPELVLGDSLLDDRKTTFFGGGDGPAPIATPTLTLPSALVREASGPRGATVTYTVAARDPRARTILVTCSPPSGSRFRLGTSTVSCSALVPRGPDVDGAFPVTVADRTPPRLNLPAPIRVTTRSGTGARVTYAPTASDVVSGRVKPSCRPRSSSQFDVGTTTVGCTARDGAGNTARGSFLVAVTRERQDEDRTAPTLSVPSSMRVEATTSRGAIVRYRATARDAVDGALNPTCSPASRTLLAIGRHTIRCSIADAAGNVTDEDFKATVFDAPPIVSVPADIREPYRPPKGRAGLTRVTYAASARDRIDGDLPAACTPSSPARFPLGETIVTCKATDSAGHTTSQTVTVTIVDTIAPRLTLEDITTYAERTVKVDYDSKHVSAFDAIDGSVPVSCDPPSGSTFTTNTKTSVSCSATDKGGNESSGSFRVIVRQPEG